MAFCSKCGQQVADGVAVCPACGAPMEAAAPQAPAYAVASTKEKLDTIPSSESSSFPLFAYIGMAGFALNLIASLFVPVGKAYGWICLIANVCILLGMFKFYTALKKGLVGHKAPLGGLCSAAMWLYVISALLTILSLLALYVMISNNTGGSAGIIATIAGGVVGVLVSIAYVVVAIVLGAKLMGNYEGNVKNIGLWLILSSAVGLLGFIPYLGAIALAACGVILFVIAIKAISPTK